MFELRKICLILEAAAKKVYKTTDFAVIEIKTSLTHFVPLSVPPICNVFDLHEDFIVKFDEVFVFQDAIAIQIDHSHEIPRTTQSIARKNAIKSVWRFHHDAFAPVCVGHPDHQNVCEMILRA